MAQPRVLFLAEAVTLAHVARSHVLAQSMSRRGYEVVFAADPRYATLFEPLQCETHTTHSISTQAFLDALKNGSPIYGLTTLRDYLKEDVELLRRTHPAVVVGDFRLSLSVSARLAGIPYINVSNAYWSPYARPDWRVPSLPMVRHFGPAAANVLFRILRRPAFRLHAGPMSQLRAENGLPTLTRDLRRVYTDGDITLYADCREFVPIFNAPSSHRYLGPVLWSPITPLPQWWSELSSQNFIYVSLGSSGDASRLADIVLGLARLDLPVVVATAARVIMDKLPPNVRLTSYLPGDSAAARSALVVCSGGSPMTYQALAHGVAVLAIPSNLDQFLNSGYLERNKLGHWIRADSVTPARVATSASALLADSTIARSTKAMVPVLRSYDPATQLAVAIGDLLRFGNATA